MPRFPPLVVSIDDESMMKMEICDDSETQTFLTLTPTVLSCLRNRSVPQRPRNWHTNYIPFPFLRNALDVLGTNTRKRWVKILSCYPFTSNKISDVLKREWFIFPHSTQSVRLHQSFLCHNLLFYEPSLNVNHQRMCYFAQSGSCLQTAVSETGIGMVGWLRRVSWNITWCLENLRERWGCSKFVFRFSCLKLMVLNLEVSNYTLLWTSPNWLADIKAKIDTNK